MCYWNCEISSCRLEVLLILLAATHYLSEFRILTGEKFSTLSL